MARDVSDLRPGLDWLRKQLTLCQSSTELSGLFAPDLAKFSSLKSPLLHKIPMSLESHITCFRFPHFNNKIIVRVHIIDLWKFRKGWYIQDHKSDHKLYTVHFSLSICLLEASKQRLKYAFISGNFGFQVICINVLVWHVPVQDTPVQNKNRSF